MRHKDRKTDRKTDRKKKRKKEKKADGVEESGSILRELVRSRQSYGKAEEQGRGGPGGGRCRRPRGRSGEESAKGARSETHSDGRVGSSSKSKSKSRRLKKEGADDGQNTAIVGKSKERG